MSPVIRKISARDQTGSDLWEAREYYDHRPGEKSTYWLSTGYKFYGFIEHRDMKDVIQFHLMNAPETDRIITSWGRDVFMQNLIPGAIADLAIQALGCAPGKPELCSLS